MAKFPVIPGYKIEKILGKGGMATVYLAVQENFGRLVALKVLHKTLVEDESWSQRFLREARTVAKMSHQSVVPVYDVGAAGVFHYMSMEYLPGGDLREKMRQGLTVLDSISIMKAIAKGLDYAGSKKLVHRDIKPENILFREDGSPVISDFGISRLTDSKTNITVTGSMVGTPHYMSPEQAQGIEVDPRSDLYSLGIMLYELLTGEVPFSGTSAINIGIKHISEQPKPLPDELKGFQKLMDKALAKVPDDRYQSGEEFCTALSLIEFSLSAKDEATVMMSKAEIRRLTNASERRVSASASPTGVRVGSAKMNRPGPGIKESNWLGNPKKLFITITGVGAMVIGGVYLGMNHAGQDDSSASLDGNFQIVLKGKADKLLDQARAAMAEKNYFGNDQNNAQYYVTTLLTINPGHTEALGMLEAIFSTFLDQAEDAISGENLPEADAALKRASSLAFYVKKKELSLRLIESNNHLNELRQKKLISQAQGNQEGLPSVNTGEGRDSVTQPVEMDQTPQTGVSEVAPVENTSSALPSEEHTLEQQDISAEDPVAVSSNTPPPEEEGVTEHSVSEEGVALALSEKEVSLRLTKAEAATARGRLSKPANDNAFSYYAEVLSAYPRHSQALTGLRELFEKYASLVDSMLSGGNLERAQSYQEGFIAVLMRKAEIPSVSQEAETLFLEFTGVANQKGQAIEKAVSERDKALSALFARAEALRRKPMNDSVNASLRQIYQQALQINPASEIARNGLMSSSGYEADQVLAWLKEGDQSKALQYVAKIAATHPEYSRLDELRALIREAEKNAEQAQAILKKAESLMSFQYEKPGLFGNNNEPRSKLKKAYELIAEARAAHPPEPGVTSALSKLEQKYLSIMNTLIKAGDKGEAKRFGEDTRSFQWEGSQVSDLLKRL